MLAQQYAAAAAAAINGGNYENNGEFYDKSSYPTAPPPPTQHHHQQQQQQQIFYNEQHMIRPPFYQFGEGARFAKPRHFAPPQRFNQQQPPQQQQRRSSGEPTKTLFVGNLAIDVGEECLHQLFAKFGQVTECCKRWFHYAFVRFEEEDQAERALKTLDGFKIAGRPMRVEFQRRKLNARFYQPPQQQQQQQPIQKFTNPKDPTLIRNPFASIKYYHNQKEPEFTPPSVPLPPFPFAESDDDPNGFSIFRRPSDKIVYRNDYKTYELFPKDEQHPLLLLIQKYKPTTTTDQSAAAATTTTTMTNTTTTNLTDHESVWKFSDLKRELEASEQTH